MTGKQMIRKVLAAAMALTMMLTMLTIPAAAKSKAKLSKTKVTITVGKSVTLRVKGTSKKAKWSVSGKKLVKIKTKGKKKHKATIKAGKKAGKCYIKVKIGKKTLKCKVIVKKKTPKPDEFKEKPLSGTSKDITEKFTSRTVTGKETDDEFRMAMTGTALEMLKILSNKGENDNKNVLISPDSILTAMAMVECGAKGNTLSEMVSAFGNLPADDFDAYLYTLNKRLTSSKNINYHLADSIWYKNNELDVRDEFLQKNVDFFGAQVFEAPFSDDTLNDINNWVYNKTKAMIPGILNDLDQDTVMILLNAIAFEGEWADKYSDNQVQRNVPFYNEQNNLMKYTFALKGTEDTYLEIKGAKGFIKDYAGGEIAFLGLQMPDNTTVDQFLNKLTPADFINGYNNRTDDYSVITQMPEFKYDFSSSLVDTLKEMGIKDAFNPDLADFTDIAVLKPDENLFISDVLHKTHIEVDRDGTKAAAVTAVVMDKASAMPMQKEKKYVTLDHPFVYAIIDTQSGIPLFIGTVKTL